MSESILKSYESKIFKEATITIEFRDMILAGIPRSGEMLDYFVKARQMSDKEKDDLIVRIKSGALTEEEKAQMKETSWCCFERDREGRLCIWNGNIKAMLREIFTTMGLTQRRAKTKAKDDAGKPAQQSAGGKQTFQHAINIEPIRILFTRLGDFITEPDGYVDRIKHIEDMSGKRSALGRHDFLGYDPKAKEQKPPVRLTFKMLWPSGGVFTDDDLKSAMAAAQYDGLGACRSQSMGRFNVVDWK